MESRSHTKFWKRAIYNLPVRVGFVFQVRTAEWDGRTDIWRFGRFGRCSGATRSTLRFVVRGRCYDLRCNRRYHP